MGVKLLGTFLPEMATILDHDELDLGVRQCLLSSSGQRPAGGIVLSEKDQDVVLHFGKFGSEIVLVQSLPG